MGDRGLILPDFYISKEWLSEVARLHAHLKGTEKRCTIVRLF